MVKPISANRKLDTFLPSKLFRKLRQKKTKTSPLTPLQRRGELYSQLSLSFLLGKKLE